MTSYVYISEDFGSIRAPLKNELVFLYDQMNFNDYSDHNRTYVRTFISLVEGTINYVKLYLLQAYAQREIELEFNERIILEGKTYSLNSKGKPREQILFFPFEPNFKFTYGLFAEKYNRSDVYQEYISRSGFLRMQTILEVRNRVTHPKKADDVFVSGAEATFAFEAYKWHEEFQLELFKDFLYKQNSLPPT